MRAQAGLGIGARGALAHQGVNTTRCSLAPISPLSSQHIPPTMQNVRRPPASPSPSEPGVGSLAPVCGALSQGQGSTDFSRAACCADAPARRHALLARGPLGGALIGRFLAFPVAWWPGAFLRKKWALRMARVPYARAYVLKIGLSDVLICGRKWCAASNVY